MNLWSLSIACHWDQFNIDMLFNISQCVLKIVNIISHKDQESYRRINFMTGELLEEFSGNCTEI